jgi:protein-L-isoaspartate O-methyltransferase
MDWQPAGPPFFDDDGVFLSPVHAATHAIIVQGGFTDPPTEAQRMLRDGGTLAARARAWLVTNQGES